MTETVSPPKPPKHRSPSYPAYDLEAALARAKQLHEAAGQSPAHVSTVVRTWGYSLQSSKEALMLSTLKKFGLAESQGKGDARVLVLTVLGRELVYYDIDRTSEEWKARARTAAMSPTVHRELWTRYDGHLPVDNIMRDYLVLEAGFSKSAAEEVIGEFRRTLGFAGIEDSDGLDIIQVPTGEDVDEQDQTVTPPAASPPRHAPPPAAENAAKRTDTSAPLPVNVNLSDQGWAKLEVSSRLTESQWKQLMAVLDAMKPGLTS